ncbi:GDP-mannose 4,6-dehydratase [Brevundimonas sp.]|uniref:GDP-mannose 4,6-dehydratase n=1 Tax=Brevundimonas sp. TaxID=1871086 RepID=UPI003D10D918
MQGGARVLVTGAGGFVGRRLVEALSRNPGADAVLALGGTATNGSKVETRMADVTTHEVEAAIETFGPSHIVHLAAKSSVAASLRDCRGVMDVSVGGALKIADGVSAYAPNAKILFASSAEVYGSAFSPGLELDETSPVAPANPYARSKLVAEFLLADRLQSDASLIVMRPLNHIGPGQDARFVVSTFAQQIAEIERGLRAPEILVGNLDAQRDFMSVDDVVDAYLRVLFSKPIEPGTRDVFNVSSGTLRSIQSVLDNLLSLSTADCEIVLDPARFRPNDIAVTRLSSAKLKEETGWAPTAEWTALLTSVLDEQRARLSV